jgi:hypothetical protein
MRWITVSACGSGRRTGTTVVPARSPLVGRGCFVVAGTETGAIRPPRTPASAAAPVETVPSASVAPSDGLTAGPASLPAEGRREGVPPEGVEEKLGAVATGVGDGVGVGTRVGTGTATGAGTGARTGVDGVGGETGVRVGAGTIGRLIAPWHEPWHPPCACWEWPCSCPCSGPGEPWAGETGVGTTGVGATGVGAPGVGAPWAGETTPAPAWP